jgi:hypothetical protein
LTNCPVLPLNAEDFELLGGPDQSWAARLFDDRQDDWSHVIYIRRELLFGLKETTVGPLAIPLMTRFKNMEVATRDVGYVYVFIKVERSNFYRGGLDQRVLQFSDEAVYFRSFFPELTGVRYDKCRSVDTYGLDEFQLREKFIKDFLERTCLR